jgi:hypothetical protein
VQLSLCSRLAQRLALAGALASSVACGGAQFDGTTYRGAGFTFQVPPPPPSWKMLEVDAAALAFRDEEGDATILVHGRCDLDGDDVPLRSLTQHLFMTFTEREIEVQEVVPFDGREAMHTSLTAKLDGVPKRFDVWVMKKDGCVYDLIYIAAPDRYPSGVGDFSRFVQGFSVLPRHDT